MQDVEHIYDEKINPLIGKIIEICREHKMPFIASFQLNDGEDDDEGPLFCTSGQILPGCDQRLNRALRVIGV